MSVAGSWHFSPRSVWRHVAQSESASPGYLLLARGIPNLTASARAGFLFSGCAPFNSHLRTRFANDLPRDLLLAIRACVL